jgi:hypothetical protein
LQTLSPHITDDLKTPSSVAALAEVPAVESTETPEAI